MNIPVIERGMGRQPGLIKLLLGLICLYLVLLPSPSGIYNGYSLTLASGGLLLLLLRWRTCWAAPGLKALAAVFACIWLPMLWAAMDGVDLSRSLEKSLLYGRFFLGGVVFVYLLRSGALLGWVRAMVVIVCGVWIADALLQAVSGVNVFGYPYGGDQLRGMFYPKYQLGVVLCVFTPVLLDVVAQRAKHHTAWWLVLAPLPLVIALTLHRNSWMMFILACIAYGVYRIIERGWRPPPWAVVSVIALPVLGVVALNQHTGFNSRLQAAAQGLFAGGEALEAQLGQRPDIWRTAWHMFTANPLDGVGPRGFRGAYKDYADVDDYWVNLEPEQQIPSHPHQLGLEVLAETGLLGALGGVLALMLLLRRYRQLSPVQRATAGPWLLCLLVAVFPANIHKAFYGHFIATLNWWLVGIVIAALYLPPAKDPSSGS